MWKWLTVFGLAAAPALVLGQSAGWAFGFRWHMNVIALGVVITFGSFAEGAVLAKVAELPRRSKRVQGWAMKVVNSRVGAWMFEKGPWPSLLVGTLFLGQEPIIVFLVWIGVPPRRLVIPLLVTNALYTVVMGILVKKGLADWDSINHML